MLAHTRFTMHKNAVLFSRPPPEANTQCSTQKFRFFAYLHFYEQVCRFDVTDWHIILITDT